MTDLQAKYQKLATEYSKLRAQIPVLKKAVLDEQATEDLLKETVKEKDQSIRKLEQEVDSLTFRNQQLASRVSVLQKELEDIQTLNKKHKKNSTVATLPDSRDFRANAGIVDEELRNKIEENARLHKQVFESDQEHRNEVMRLQDRLSTLEAETAQHESVLNTITSTNKEKISKLQEEKAMLEIKIQKQERDTKDTIQRAAELDEQLTKIKEELGSQLEDVLSVVQKKLPFNDSCDKKLNSLNVPCHNHQHQLQARELISQANVLVRDFVQGFTDFYTYSEERAKVFVDDQGTLSDVNKKYCQHLHGHMTVLQPIRQSFQQLHDSVADDDVLVLLETVTGLQNFAASWQNFVVYVQKLLPYQLLSLEGECALSSCPSTLASKNMEFHGSLQMLASNLTRADSYLSLLAAQSSGNNSHPKSSHATMFTHLSRGLVSLNESMKDLSRHFNTKVSLEHQLPTTTQRLKVADECILSALVSLVTVTGKISAFFSGNLSFFTRPSSGEAFADPVEVAANPAVSKLRQRATEYMSLINRPPSESVPYSLAIQNRKTVYSFTESKDSLMQQIVTLQERLGRLEQEREHWMLETQLMQMKYQKEAQKLTAIQKSDQPAPETKSNPTTTSKTTNDANGYGIVNSSMLLTLENLTLPAHLEKSFELAEEDRKLRQKLKEIRIKGEVLDGVKISKGRIVGRVLGHVDAVNANDDNVEFKMREDLISSHYQRRVTELTTNLQMADSKALHFYAECRAMQKRLALCQKEKEKMQDDLYQCNQTVAQLKDELQTTTRSYEGQLSMMSDHLAGMNEKLTTQKDEIDVLKYQLQQIVKPTAGKKGKAGK